MKNIFWIILIVLLSPVIAYGTAQYVPFYDGFIVQSGSMEPEIGTGSVLFTKPTQPENVAIGDTITYSTGEMFTTHKVIQKNSSNNEVSFKTKGIANENPDPGRVTGDQLAGKKVLSVPYLGYILAWTGTLPGFLSLIVVPGVLIVLLELKELRNEAKS